MHGGSKQLGTGLIHKIKKDLGLKQYTFILFSSVISSRNLMKLLIILNQLENIIFNDFRYLTKFVV